MDRARIRKLADFHRTALVDDTLAFWKRHGVDREAGGFFTYLERDGTVYCTDKPVWFMGRATWLYATLHQLVEARSDWLDLARHGYRFLERHGADESGKMYFRLTRDGRPLQMRRYVFSEVFAVMGYAALYAATGEAQVLRRTVEIFDALVRHLKTPGLIEPKTDPHVRPMKSLSPSMCLLSVAEAMVAIDPDPRYERMIDEEIEAIFNSFVRPDERIVLETVGPSGERIETPEGRRHSPGHAIETAWFLLEIARRRGDRELMRRALPILDWSFERGWDSEYGGLVYFVDADGKPPAHLEHDMKLWWPHSEALYATLLAFHVTGDAKYAEMYERVHEWTFDHFPDAEHGEWFGYLRRDGSLTTTLKGNLWKGPFHLPRAQMLCWKLLTEMGI